MRWSRRRRTGIRGPEGEVQPTGELPQGAFQLAVMWDGRDSRGASVVNVTPLTRTLSGDPTNALRGVPVPDWAPLGLPGQPDPGWRLGVLWQGTDERGRPVDNVTQLTAPQRGNPSYFLFGHRLPGPDVSAEESARSARAAQQKLQAWWQARTQAQQGGDARSEAGPANQLPPAEQRQQADPRATSRSDPPTVPLTSVPEAAAPESATAEPGPATASQQSPGGRHRRASSRRRWLVAPLAAAGAANLAIGSSLAGIEPVNVTASAPLAALAVGMATALVQRLVHRRAERAHRARQLKHEGDPAKQVDPRKAGSHRYLRRPRRQSPHRIKKFETLTFPKKPKQNRSGFFAKVKALSKLGMEHMLTVSAPLQGVAATSYMLTGSPHLAPALLMTIPAISVVALPGLVKQKHNADNVHKAITQHGDELLEQNKKLQRQNKVLLENQEGLAAVNRRQDDQLRDLRHLSEKLGHVNDAQTAAIEGLNQTIGGLRATVDSQGAELVTLRRAANRSDGRTAERSDRQRNDRKEGPSRGRPEQGRAPDG